MKLTIFTPVYNRAGLLKTLYESLLKQTNKNFVWLIVDDGSTDNVKDVIDEWKKKCGFEIKYIYQENHGKHFAHNTAVQSCMTDLFFCVDSDDYLSDNAVEKIYETHNEFKGQDVLGYFFRKANTDGEISGGRIDLDKQLIGLREIYFKNNFSGELAIILKTALIKEYSFPVFEGEKFVSESVFYNPISKIAPMVFVDDVIYFFEYQDSGYTKTVNRLMAKNPKGTAMLYYSDAVYGTNCLKRAKAYGTYIGIKFVFNLSDSCFNERIPMCVRLLGLLLKPHYVKIFREIDREYNQ